MNFSLIYLASRFFYRIKEFIYNWYAGGGRLIARKTLNVLESLDRFFAWRINLKNLLEPLYQDHSAIGHALGFIFRTLRIAAGSLAYLLIIAAAAFLYLVWIVIPAYLIFRAFQ